MALSHKDLARAIRILRKKLQSPRALDNPKALSHKGCPLTTQA